jgi:tripartite-type tricarboxylate transporter receptor subunit TctC
MSITLPFSRRNFLRVGLAVGLVGAAPRVLANWPLKPLKIIVPFPPGGGADISARALAEQWAAPLAQAVVVENRPGAGSVVGVSFAAKSNDQHTLLMGSNSMLLNQILNPEVTYDVWRDFDVIGMVSQQALALVVPANHKAQSFTDLIALAKAAPGTITAGSSGNGTLAHLTAELFGMETQGPLMHIPYKGESALMPDLLSGQIQCGFLNLPSVAPHLKSGKLRALAVTAPEPVAEFPSVPTVRSLGFARLEVQGWASLLAPKGLAPDDQKKLAALLTQSLQSDVVKQRLGALNVAPFALSGSAAAEYLRNDFNRWQTVIKTRGIKLGT